MLGKDRPWLRWGCSRCGREDTSGERDGEPAESPFSDEQRRHLRNCDGPTNPAASPLSCPWSTIEPWTWVVVGWWLAWDGRSALPYPGDWADQPAYVEEAIDMCRSIESQMRPKEA